MAINDTALVIKLADDTVKYFEEHDKFDGLGFALAVGEDAMKVLFEISDIADEIKAITPDEASYLVQELLPLVVRALKLVSKK